MNIGTCQINNMHTGNDIVASRMRWFGHVEHSTGWIAEVRILNVVAHKSSDRPKKSWDEVLENDRKKLGIYSPDPDDVGQNNASCQRQHDAADKNVVIKSRIRIH